MLRDQKNINRKVVAWLLLCVYVGAMHYLAYTSNLDVLHINKTYQVSRFSFTVKDVFLFYDAPPQVRLNIQWHLNSLGGHLKDFMHAYLIYALYKVIKLVIDWYSPKQLRVYKQVHLFTAVYLFYQLYNLLSYLLCAGQFLHGYPLAVYSMAVVLIFCWNEVVAKLKKWDL